MEGYTQQDIAAHIGTTRQFVAQIAQQVVRKADGYITKRNYATANVLLELFSTPSWDAWRVGSYQVFFVESIAPDASVATLRGPTLHPQGPVRASVSLKGAPQEAILRSREHLKAWVAEFGAPQRSVKDVRYKYEHLTRRISQ